MGEVRFRRIGKSRLVRVFAQKCWIFIQPHTLGENEGFQNLQVTDPPTESARLSSLLSIPDFLINFFICFFILFNLERALAFERLER